MPNMNLRIIDVNMNRALESLRVIEDIIRFNFNEKNLTKKIKNFRLSIAHALKSYSLIFYRNIGADEGKFLNTKKEFDRFQLSDIITANARRLQESARVLEEFFKINNVSLSKLFKSLRFFAYDLEQKLIIRLKSKLDLSFYGILDTSLIPVHKILPVAKDLIHAKATMIQLRCKNLMTNQFYNIALTLKKFLAPYRIPLIINDRIDIALAIDANGVHCGKNDLKPSILRQALFYQKIIGYSSTTEKEILQGIRYKADYIGLGPVLATTTKKDASTPLGIKRTAYLYNKYIQKIPIVIIGGITLDNIQSCLDQGIKNFAIISAILQSNNIRKTAKKFNQIIQGVHK